MILIPKRGKQTHKLKISFTIHANQTKNEQKTDTYKITAQLTQTYNIQHKNRQINKNMTTL